MNNTSDFDTEFNQKSNKEKSENVDDKKPRRMLIANIHIVFDFSS